MQVWAAGYEWLNIRDKKPGNILLFLHQSNGVFLKRRRKEFSEIN